MAFILDDYFHDYIQHADEFDKKVALHLKEIIPKTTHLDKKVFKEIIEELKKEIESGKDFKTAFHKVSEKHILKGKVIKAKLPRFLVRIILDETEFVEKISEERGVPSSQEEIKETVDSRKINEIAQLFKKTGLAVGKVVFATFNEIDWEIDPLIDNSLPDIVNMLALHIDAYQNTRPLTAVSIRYRNKDDIIKRFPVFVDAGWHDKFYPADEGDKYGRTRSLDPSLKSMPEVIHENLKLADVIEDIRFLEEKRGSSKESKHGIIETRSNR